jgi:hypothetical protein
MLSQLTSTLVALAVASVARASSLTVVNKCSEGVLLNTQSSYGTIDNNVNLGAGSTHNMHISSDWDGAINIGMLAAKFNALL